MTDTFEPFGIPDTFCETLVRIERIGSCRRLVFCVSDRSEHPAKCVVAKLVFPAEAMADLAPMIAADHAEPDAVFARHPLDTVKH